jgi:hypothetical protein
MSLYKYKLEPKSRKYIIILTESNCLRRGKIAEFRDEVAKYLSFLRLTVECVTLFLVPEIRVRSVEG